ncbi:protein-tyrosine phosphatase family protein [Tautonia plasticadhaerens]|uniref:protein-tyrosine phosphatase family protein n=1 Tax=Tautonia plasticadhaerens TaxID=2527974 RepID=UPI0018D209C2|nr:hypothetical protein [Tautonia plasticadhaerens]
MSRRARRRVAILAALAVVVPLTAFRHDLFEKRVRVIAPGVIVRGAWQRPGPLRRMIEREGIRTVVTLTAINAHDPKYVDQERVIRRTGVDWVIVPMRGSTATLDQLAEAADLLANPDRQPVFFHCVGGHHRTNLVHAAYRIRHEGWSAARAWRELERFPWTEPEDALDDRPLIEAFAALHRPSPEEAEDGPQTDLTTSRPIPGGDPAADLGPRRLAMGDGERRRR